MKKEQTAGRGEPQDGRLTEFLMDELNGIDDAFLEEASSYSENREKAKRMRRGFRLPPAAVISLSAACAVILFAVLIRFAIRGILMQGPGPLPAESGQNAEPSGDRAEEPAQEAKKDPLADVLKNAGKGQTVAGTGDANIFGTPQLVWRTETDGVCRSVALTKAQSDRLVSLVATSGKAGRRFEGGRADVKMWILREDGTVVTPYLAFSPGNVGYGTLFDYEPELIPEGRIVSLVSDIVGRA